MKCCNFFSKLEFSFCHSCLFQSNTQPSHINIDIFILNLLTRLSHIDIYKLVYFTLRKSAATLTVLH